MSLAPVLRSPFRLTGHTTSTPRTIGKLQQSYRTNVWYLITIILIAWYLIMCVSAHSGEDVCKQVSAVADQVIVAARSWKNPDWAKDPRPFGPRHNVSRRGMISQLHPDGRVAFSEVCNTHTMRKFVKAHQSLVACKHQMESW
eukprot:GHUV01022905.1.p1 GENE.GHUV01022905.1~~GHUV01022905.1.p1  ORF type:complete len:143 (+),score=5.61 GHUV01022905.1:99-527(+)